MFNEEDGPPHGGAKKEYTILLHTTRHTGVWTRIAMIVSRRRINVESMYADASGVDGRWQFTLVIRETLETVKQLCLQFEKQVEIEEVSYISSDRKTRDKTLS
jgi:acetolactate synthase I/III small subunit